MPTFTFTVATQNPTTTVKPPTTTLQPQLTTKKVVNPTPTVAASTTLQSLTTKIKTAQPPQPIDTTAQPPVKGTTEGARTTVGKIVTTPRPGNAGFKFEKEYYHVRKQKTRKCW